MAEDFNGMTAQEYMQREFIASAKRNPNSVNLVGEWQVGYIADHPTENRRWIERSWDFGSKAEAENFISREIEWCEKCDGVTDWHYVLRFRFTDSDQWNSIATYKS